MSGKFTYQLPENVTEVHELYLEDVDWNRKGRKKLKLNKTEYQAFRSLVHNRNVEWEAVFRLFQEKPVSLDKLLMGGGFSEDRKRILRSELQSAGLFGFFMDRAFRISAAFVYLKNEAAQSRSVPLSGHRICGSAGQHGEGTLWQPIPDL